jgi:hypothetical protein
VEFVLLLVMVVRVRKVLDLLGSLIRALRDLKTTILVVALFEDCQQLW